ncbi:MAG: ferric reductase-like transmembrane domain-containing protein [Caldilineaceae bacterium]
MNGFAWQRVNRNWLQLLVNSVGVLLSMRTGWLIIQAPQAPGWVLFTDSPILRDIVLFTGKSGLIFLVLSLACTPLARLLGWQAVLRVRKALGLWGFGFACFHSLFFLQGKQLFVGLNFGPELWQAGQDMIGIVRYGSKVPYAEAGVYALLLLSLLALTSNRLSMRLLGKNWKRLHRLVYLALPVAIYHYWWRTATEFPVPPMPGYWQPILFAMIVGLLLGVRIPPVQQRLVSMLPSRWQPTKLRTARRTAKALPVAPTVSSPDVTTPLLLKDTHTVGSLVVPHTNGLVHPMEPSQERAVEQV